MEQSGAYVLTEALVYSAAGVMLGMVLWIVVQLLIWPVVRRLIARHWRK